MIKNDPWLQQSEVNFFNNIYIIQQQQQPLLYLLKLSKFQKQIFLFSFPPKTKQNWFCSLFGGNENKKVYFWKLLTFSDQFEQKFPMPSAQTRLAWTDH